MTDSTEDKIAISTLFIKPGITIWYCQIPRIIRSIFCKTVYHNYTALVNEIFEKNDFVPGLFSQGEIDTVNSFKAFKKQIEWLSGRYLIKQLIGTNYLPKMPRNRIMLGALEQGAPFVIDLPDLPISLSHSYDYTAAAVCHDRSKTIGLDLEKIREKPDRTFLKTAFTKEEIRHMPDTAESIFKHWTIKEAFLKYIKKGFNESLHKVEVIDNTIYHRGEKKTVVNFQSVKITKDYILSLVHD